MYERLKQLAKEEKCSLVVCYSTASSKVNVAILKQVQ